MAPVEGKVTKKRARNVANASAIMEGMFELVRSTLTAVLNEEQVDRAIAQAKKLPAVKRMLAGVKAPKAAGGGGGPKAVRSAYMAFTTLTMAALKASNRGDLANMTLVGQTWNKLPPAVKGKVEERLNALKERYNAALSAGTATGGLPEELKKLERETGAEAIDFTALISKYKDYPTQPKAEAAPKGPPGRPKKADAPVLALEAPPAAAAPAAGEKKAEEGDGKKKERKHKHDKKEKKEKHRKADE
ncbi:hypothetical protein MNEG_5597 [Monoraphidium neglectum]|uniref:HMG box domain-containing protein n=1 Tax=Monoraphidium neglectum TaxID=145388 RepID=A0A0D2L5R1_9CHLO|nr:hypothetical protein MNEG_5597 [Monoraphidium neglectum]KIZ02359.1 hypothetical protein MNEG_5597 [Monoraphidium neglectum]|eukprot:XP_013901378.1 hypothetical protein MNEG_5597 [Monoraphidium neglectum]